MQHRRILGVWKDLLSLGVWEQVAIDIAGLAVATRVRALFNGEEATACCEADVEDYVWGWHHGEKFRDNVDDVPVGDADRLMVDVDVDWCWVAGRGRYQGG